MTSDANLSQTPAESLDVLACNVYARPKGAPSFSDLQAAIRGVQREGDRLRVDFDPDRRDDVRQLVAAERLCCPTIGWDLREAPGLTLRISATLAQIEVFEQFLGHA